MLELQTLIRVRLAATETIPLQWNALNWRCSPFTIHDLPHFHNNIHHGRTTLRLDNVSVGDAISSPFPTSLCVEYLKPLKLYINASCLATFHERWRTIFKLFTSPAPSLVESTTKLCQEFGFPCINALFYARLASLVYIIQVGPHHIRPCYDCILVLGRPAMC